MHIRSSLRIAVFTCGTLVLSKLADARAQERSLEQMLPEYSRCIAIHMPNEARAFVLSSQDLENGAPAKVNRPTADRCSYVFAGNEEVRFIPSWYRDELALPLVQAEFASQGPNSFADKKQLEHSRRPRKGNPRYVYAKMELDNSRLGECIARSTPEVVRAWIVASNDLKRGRFATEIDNAGQKCSRDLNANFIVERARGPIARGYYRLAYAPSLKAMVH